MSTAITTYNDLDALVTNFRNTLTPANGDKGKNCILLYAYNGTGKTRLSMDFRQAGKKFDQEDKVIERDTLYFNAFTEDLFSWDNDLENDTERVLKLNRESQFFAGLSNLEMESRIGPLLERYADFNFFINYEKWTVAFSRQKRVNEETITEDFIKISRGEENLFIWCFFLAIAELAIDKQETYSWVKYIYIDDPISSLDENNAIALANHLSQLLKKEGNTIKTIISTHHILCFNVLYNDLCRDKKLKGMSYFLHKKKAEGYALRETKDTPFYHHIAALSELKQAMLSDNIKTFHFNTLRSILEKTAIFFGFSDFGWCIRDIEDKMLFERALNLLSHGKYSVYEPVNMVDDTKELFKRILTTFLDRYEFYSPEILLEEHNNQ